MQSDGIHPDANGDAHIADAFLSVMDQVDICPPDTTITSPSSAGQLLSGSYTFTGTATDIGNTGINRVRIAIEDNNHTNDNNRWFNFSTGTFGSFSATVATLTNVTASSTDWNINTVLPRGDYTLYALAIDNADRQNYYNIGLWPTNQQFFVSADNTLPTISIDPIGSQTSGNVNISGDANDNVAIDRTSLLVNNITTGQFWNGSAWVNSTASFNINDNSNDWSYSINLTSGEYRVIAWTWDTSNNRARTGQNANLFTVQ